MKLVEDQNSWVEVPISGDYGEFWVTQDPQLYPYYDTSQITPTNNDSKQQDEFAAGRDETAVDYTSDIFEFFDIQNAALDSDSFQPPQSEPQLTSATSSVNLDSILSKNATLDGRRSDKGSNHPNFTPTAPTSLDPQLIEHVIDPAEPSPTASSMQSQLHNNTTHLSKNEKRPLEENLLGIPCLDSDIGSKTRKRQKKLTSEQLDGVRRVRAHGACLRCYVQKLKCSEKRPCNTCQVLFNKAYASKTLEWTACISSRLPDLNLFALGISLSDGHGPAVHEGQGHPKLDLDTALPLYSTMFESGKFADMILDLDCLYVEVLRHGYGNRAPEVHPFILEERNPLYMLIELNVILLGIPVIGPELLGCVRYLQELRAICGILAFECLGKALGRTTLAESNPVRQAALIIQAALLLDQVLEMAGDLPAAVISFAHGKTYDDMHQHLIQYISYYLRRLLSGIFREECPIFDCIRNAKRGGGLSEAFWDILSDLVPSMPLQRPPKLREYADMGWNTSGSEEGQALHTLFASQCSITCN